MTSAAPDTPFTSDDQPRWAPVHQSLRIWGEVLAKGVRERGPDLSARQLAVLLTVYLLPGPHTVRGLSAHLELGKPAVTRALDTLGQLGFIKRRRDEADKRNVLIHRTVKGAVFLTEFGERIEAERQEVVRAAHG